MGNEILNQGHERRLWLLMVLLALWLAAYGYSVIFVLSTQVEGSGFTRGLGRISGFLGWQGVAGTLAFASWGVGRGFPRRTGIRRISAVPLGMALAVIFLILGAVALAAARG